MLFTVRLLRLNLSSECNPVSIVSCLCCGSLAALLLSGLPVWWFARLFSALCCCCSSLSLRPFFNAVPLCLWACLFFQIFVEALLLSRFSLLQDVWLCAWVFDKHKLKLTKLLSFTKILSYFEIKWSEMKSHVISSGDLSYLWEPQTNLIVQTFCLSLHTAVM